MERYDIAVIGTGPGGISAAITGTVTGDADDIIIIAESTADIRRLHDLLKLIFLLL